MGIRVFIVDCKECEKLVFIQTGHFSDSTLRLEWVVSLSRELTAWPDWNLSCSAPAVVTLQLPCMLHTCATLVTYQSRDPVSRLLWLHTSWVFFTFSHTLSLHKSYLYTGYLIAKLQANLSRNKANTWLNKFNLTKNIDAIMKTSYIDQKKWFFYWSLIKCCIRWVLIMKIPTLQASSLLVCLSFLRYSMYSHLWFSTFCLYLFLSYLYLFQALSVHHREHDVMQ